MIEDDHQRCRWCGEGLYRVKDWAKEIDRHPEQRSWFCGEDCKTSWFRYHFPWWNPSLSRRWRAHQQLLEREAEVLAKREAFLLDRPCCPDCGNLMRKRGRPGAGYWGCKCGKWIRKKPK